MTCTDMQNNLEREVRNYVYAGQKLSLIPIQNKETGINEAQS